MYTGTSYEEVSKGRSLLSEASHRISLASLGFSQAIAWLAHAYRLYLRGSVERKEASIKGCRPGSFEETRHILLSPSAPWVGVGGAVFLVACKLCDFSTLHRTGKGSSGRFSSLSSQI